jgi:hydroxyacylglutathione hydrolase
MQIKSIPMWTGTGNNYAYLVIDDDTRKALVIDPANPEEVIPTIQDEKVDLVGIVNTHHHSDHSHGNKKLLELLNLEHLPITGGVKCQAVTNTPADKSEFTLGNKVVFRALHTPCHTQDSICYYVTDGGPERAIFTGDTLFISGCGRFFEGNAEEMDTALNKVLASLPDDTKVYVSYFLSLYFFYFLCPIHISREKKNFWPT